MFQVTRSQTRMYGSREAGSFRTRVDCLEAWEPWSCMSRNWESGSCESMAWDSSGWNGVLSSNKPGTSWRISSIFESDLQHLTGHSCLAHPLFRHQWLVAKHKVANDLHVPLELRHSRHDEALRLLDSWIKLFSMVRSKVELAFCTVGV